MHQIDLHSFFSMLINSRTVELLGRIFISAQVARSGFHLIARGPIPLAYLTSASDFILASNTSFKLLPAAFPFFFLSCKGRLFWPFIHSKLKMCACRRKSPFKSSRESSFLSCSLAEFVGRVHLPLPVLR